MGKETSGLLHNANRLLADIKCILKDAPQEESLVPITFCDEECDITGAIAFTKDENTGNPNIHYFDNQLQPSVTVPTGSPCGSNCDWEINTIENCFEDSNDLKVKQLISIFYRNKTEVETKISWILPSGEITTTRPGGLSPCDVDCTPQIQDFSLQDSISYIPFTSLTFIGDGCCWCKIKTTAGDINIRKGIKSFASNNFACKVNITEVELIDCPNADKSFLYLQNKGCSNCNE